MPYERKSKYTDFIDKINVAKIDCVQIASSLLHLRLEVTHTGVNGEFSADFNVN